MEFFPQSAFIFPLCRYASFLGSGGSGAVPSATIVGAKSGVGLGSGGSGAVPSATPIRDGFFQETAVFEQFAQVHIRVTVDTANRNFRAFM